MNFSVFGRKFSEQTGILGLMDDMARAVADALPEKAMLGGGNPAHVPEIQALWRKRMGEVLSNGDEFERMVANYDTPRGRGEFLEAVAGFLSREYGWPITADHIAVTNGSQSAFFYLLNLYAGRYADNSVRRIVFPLMPEYIGYADQSVFAEDLAGVPARIELHGDHGFKYRVDAEALAEMLEGRRFNAPQGAGREKYRPDGPVGKGTVRDMAALCVSRPTNPTGNVLTDEEVRALADMAKRADIPLFVDNAYGLPFPGIVFTEAEPYWDEHVILSMSLSKLGLPSTRTGIIVAHPKVISAISGLNAVMSLATGNLGQVLTLPLFIDGSMATLGRRYLVPYYRAKSLLMQGLLAERLGSLGISWKIHESEGAFFLWLWLPDFPAAADEIYRVCKEKGLVIVPGHYFFYGLHDHDREWATGHGSRCLRISFARPDDELERGSRILSEALRSLLRNP